MTETEPTEQLTISPYGDLKLCLKTSSTSTAFLVSSHQLCYASPVFRDLIPESNDRRFFFSAVIDLRGLRAATPSDSDDSTVIYELDIDDKLGIDPTNMAVVLYAIHGRSEHFPETITFEKLLEIAVICEHYRCAEMMSPWDKLWMKLPELEKLVLQPGYEDWLFIARVFGNQELFGRITKQLTRNVVKTEDGKLGVMVREEVKKMHSRLPERIIKDMAAQHAKAVNDIIRLSRQTYDMYHDNSTVKCKHGQKYCDRIVFAFLHMELPEQSLFEVVRETRIPTAWYRSLEDESSKQPNVHETRPLETIISDFKNLWSSIRQSLGKVWVDSDCGGVSVDHSECIESPEEKVKMFDPCLENIESLTLETYIYYSSYEEPKKPAEAVTWNGVLQQDIIKQDTYGYVRTDKQLAICPYGDLEIYYYNSKITFRVSSHAVRTASPILRHLLERMYPFNVHTRLDPSSYGTQRHSLRMDEVHDSTVLAVVFYAIHGLGKKIPNEIDFSHLYDISVLCEKYRCATIMQPWCRNWVERLRSTIDKPENGGWLYIAWVFGLDDVFQTLTRRLITSTVIGGYGRFIISEDDRNPTVLGEHIPRDVIWKISEKESDARRQMVEACRSLYQLYCNPSDENCVLSCTTAAGRKLCSRLIFADLYWGFMSINMLENNNIKIPSIPLTTVVRDINKVLGSMEAIPQTTGVRKCDHSLCIRQVKETNRAVQTILGEITLDLAKCGWKEESRESVVVDPYDDDYY